VTVGEDITAFTAQGLDMHIDILLAGLRRWVRDGRYKPGDGTIRSALRMAHDAHDDQGVVTDAWTSAVYGEKHPYAHAGFARHASPDLSVDDAKDFRRAHFTPDNATLVISGRFDGPLADRWIDFLFGDWKGQASVRSGERATTSAASLARDADTTQIGIVVAIPARNGTRAQQLVAAAMLDEIAGDIRHQLGASYTLDANLGEDRLATTYLISGAFDASRAHDAMDLVRTRLEQLARDPESKARAFVTARTRVLAQLSASEGTAGQIANRVESDVQLGRPPLSDLATAAEVHGLTIDAMSSALADLVLTGAAIQMFGPASEVDAAFAALGRTATRLPPPPKREKVVAKADPSTESETISLSDLVEPLTGQPPATRFRLTAVPFALAAGKVLGHGVTGYGFALSGEFRLDRVTSFGLQASISSLDGTHDLGDALPIVVPISVVPISISALLRGTAYDRIWGGFSIGFHANRYTDADDPTAWEYGFGVGLQGGVDILKFGRHRAGLFAAFDTDLFTTTSTTQVSLGVAYRL
jgi:predicted Zn-dependent peptidase